MASISKTVVVTGCTQNSIGDALAREFARRGCHVIATARSLDRISHLRPLGIETIELDLLSSVSIQRFCSQIQHVDILFNNAGMVVVAPFADTTDEDLKRVFQVNVFGPAQLTRALIPLLIEARGVIVNHTSQSAYTFNVHTGAYGGSKAALATMTDVLRIELKPFGIRVVEVVTGIVQSNITGRGDGILKGMSLPTGSIYSPAKAEIEHTWHSDEIFDRYSKPDVYAKQVVSDVLDGHALWVWRGYLASVAYWFWFIKCHWKGGLDSLFAKAGKLDVLTAKLQEQQKSKQS